MTEQKIKPVVNGGISLTVVPRKVYTWQNFCASKPPYSIALDGFVAESVQRVVMAPPNGPYANFDHHKGCDRLSTRSTSEQVFKDFT